MVPTPSQARQTIRTRRKLPSTVPAIPVVPDDSAQKISLELALERNWLGVIGPGVVSSLFSDGAVQIATLKSSGEGMQALFDSVKVLYYDGRKELVLYDLLDRGLRDDLADFLPYTKGTGTFMPILEDGARENSRPFTRIMIESQKGLDLILSLVQTELSLERGDYYDHGLLFSRMAAAGVPLKERQRISLKTAVQREVNPGRLSEYLFRSRTGPREEQFDFGLGLSLQYKHTYGDARLDLLPWDENGNRTDSGRARLNFLLGRLSSRYPYSPDGIEEIREGISTQYGVLIHSQRDLEDLISFMDESLKIWESGSEVYRDLISKLHQAGILEEALWENRDFWGFVTEISANQTISRNYTFYVRDEKGNKWVLKTNRTRERAEREAAYNYHLSEHFDFVARGFSSQPIKFGDALYFTLQEEVSPLYTGFVSPLEHKIACMARFHREAVEVLQRNGVKVSEKALYSQERMEDELTFLRNAHFLGARYSLPYDAVFIREALTYLEETDYHVLVHGDVKSDNWVGNHLVDGEEYGLGHPALDLALLFMQEELPKSEWKEYLHSYLVLKNNGAEPEPAEERKLCEGMRYAPVYIAIKEILGSTLRECSRLGNHLLLKTQKANARLCQYTEEELRDIVGRR